MWWSLKLVLQTETQRSPFSVCPWSLLTIVNFSERGPKTKWYFNVSSPSSLRDNKINQEINRLYPLNDQLFTHVETSQLIHFANWIMLAFNESAFNELNRSLTLPHNFYWQSKMMKIPYRTVFYRVSVNTFQIFVKASGKFTLSRAESGSLLP